jgi:hypothetical protein
MSMWCYKLGPELLPKHVLVQVSMAMPVEPCRLTSCRAIVCVSAVASG